MDVVTDHDSFKSGQSQIPNPNWITIYGVAGRAFAKPLPVPNSLASSGCGYFGCCRSP